MDKNAGNIIFFKFTFHDLVLFMHSLGENMLVLTQHTNLSNIFADLSTNKIKQIPTMICAI
jgi:hypothetical protein